MEGSAAGPPLSQLSSPTVFVDYAGHPLKTFIEASSVAFRPQLIRKLRSGGGVVCHAPGDAQLLFVDPTTEASREIVSAWGEEPGKVILDAEWITKSAQRGHALLASEGWGGHLVATGGPAPGVLGLGDIYQSPLLTPRQTPSELAPSQPSQFNGVDVVTQDMNTKGSDIVSNTPLSELHTQTDTMFRFYALLYDIAKHGIVDSHSRINGQTDAVLAPEHSQVVPEFTRPLSPEFRPSITPDDHSSFSVPSSSQTSRHTLKRKPSSSSTEEPLALSSPKDKGKGRAHGHSSKLVHVASGLNELDNAPATPNSARDHVVAARQKGRIFVDDREIPLQFIVQIDLRNRGDIIQTIKQNGGKIMSDITKADYVVLSHTSASFENMLKLSENNNRTAIQPNFIYECVSAEALLNPEDFSFEGVTIKKKKGRPSLSSVVKLKKHHPQTSKKEKLAKTPVKDVKMDTKHEPPDSAGPSYSHFGHYERSPTPPMKVVEFSEGRNLYTEEDYEYVTRYVPILLARDPAISAHFIASKLYAKMPHHTVKSWGTYVGKHRDFIDECRKKAYIAKRKRDHCSQQLQFGASTPPMHTTPTLPRSLESSHQQPNLVVAESDFKPFEAIVEFFSSGRADSIEKDEDVWEMLAAMYPSHSASWWDNFWKDHDKEVHEAVTRRRGDI